MSNIARMMQRATAGAGGGALNVEDVFSTYLYTGTGASQTITNGIDLDGEGGLVWIKKRSGSANHYLSTNETGGGWLYSNQTNALVSSGNTTTFEFQSNGFINAATGTNTNGSGEEYASWTFRKAPKFFDIVTYEGNNETAFMVNHNLGVTPGMIILKAVDSSSPWFVWHRGLSSASHAVRLNLNNAQSSDSNYEIGLNASDTQIYIDTGSDINYQGTYIAYLFAHNNNDGEFGPDSDQDIIKCGSYVSNETSPPEITLGFEPQWILIKKSTGVDEWAIFDNMRGVVTGGNDFMLRADTTQVEYSAANQIDFTSTGFKLTTAGLGVTNAPTGETYIYMAIRRGTKVPESATEVFALETIGATNAGSLPSYASGFPVDMLIQARRDADNNMLLTRLLGETRLFTNLTNAESAESDSDFDYQDGAFSNTSVDTNRLGYMFRRAPGYFDVVAYTGNGTRGRTVTHNLGAIPEMMWIKNRDDAQNWLVYIHSLGGTKKLYLNANSAAATASIDDFNNTDAEATQFTLGNDGRCNANNQDYIAYLFASLPGISKVGSYTGTGSTLNIDCGFSSGARFVLLKKSSGSGNWYVFDTERGIVAGNDPYLYLNLTNAEVNSRDGVDPLSSGFALTSDSTFNASGATYIFYAIA